MPLVYRAMAPGTPPEPGKEAAVRAAEMRDIIISKLKDGPKTTPELVEMTGSAQSRSGSGCAGQKSREWWKAL